MIDDETAFYLGRVAEISATYLKKQPEPPEKFETKEQQSTDMLIRAYMRLFYEAVDRGLIRKVMVQ